MAHELKNPLSILRFCLSDAEEAVRENDSGRALVELERSQKSLERLLVIASKLGTKNRALPKENLVVEDMILELVNMYKSLLKAENIKIISVKSKSNADLRINGSRLELMGAISNIIDNAIDFYKDNNGHERLIELITFSKQSHISIIISNYGPEILNGENIFNELHSTKKGLARGMGLVIARDIITSHGGKLEYEYVDNKVQFKITLPSVN